MCVLEIATSHVYPRTSAIGQKKYFKEIAAATLEKQLQGVPHLHLHGFHYHGFWLMYV